MKGKSNGTKTNLDNRIRGALMGISVMLVTRASPKNYEVSSNTKNETSYLKKRVFQIFV